MKDVENLLVSMYGSAVMRPHWGKVHHRKADTLRGAFAKWDEWLALRAQLDPNKMWRNSYLKAVFFGTSLE